MNNENRLKVATIFEELRKKCANDLNPAEASRLLVAISSLYGTLIDIFIDAQMDYNRKYEAFADEVEKITEARARAEASDEYEQQLRWEGKVKVCGELIDSLKYLLKVKLDDWETLLGVRDRDS